MNSFLKQGIIIPAWDIIKKDSKIKKFYFFPWILSIIFLTVLLVYQSIYTYVEVFWKKQEALVIILKFFHSDYLLGFIITSIVFLLFYIIVIPIYEWALIKYIDAKNRKESCSLSDSIWLWMYRFLPLFEYNNIFSEFKFISILNGYLFVIRFVWVEYIGYVSFIFIIIFLFSIIINLMLAYCKYEIVIWNKKTFESIWSSSKIAILNIKTTITLYFLMFLLNIRVIINFLIFLSFPIIIVLAIWLFTSKIFLTIAITIISILFLFFILILWYITAVLDIFKTSIWYFAYMNWKKRLDNIEMNQSNDL